jgi:hypothetical protein
VIAAAIIGMAGFVVCMMAAFILSGRISRWEEEQELRDHLERRP